MKDIRSIFNQDNIARTISALFHPFLIPMYGLAIIFTAPTLYMYVPFEVKRLLLLIILVNNILLPLSLLPLFIRHNFITSWSLSDKKERMIPLLINAVLSLVTTFIILRFRVPVFLKSYFIALSLLSLAAITVNYLWNLSLYSLGAGVLVAVVIMLSVKMYTPLLLYLIPAILAGGLLLSARLKLNAHSPVQVWFGFLTGFAGLVLVMWFF
jgi:hypothetical protein